MSYHDDPMHIDRVRERRAERDAERLVDGRSPMFPGLFSKIRQGIKDNDAAELRRAGFPESIVQSWNADTHGDR
jgi:hypothetical protein